MRMIDVLVDDSDECAGCARRWKAEDEPRVVRTLRYEELVCDVTGREAGAPCPARAVTVEDSGGGTAILVWGGDGGVRIQPREGGDAIAEPFLLIAPEDVLE